MAEAANCFIQVEGCPTLAELVEEWEKRIQDCRKGYADEMATMVSMAKEREGGQKRKTAELSEAEQEAAEKVKRMKDDMKAFKKRVDTGGVIKSQLKGAM